MPNCNKDCASVSDGVDARIVEFASRRTICAVAISPSLLLQGEQA